MTNQSIPQLPSSSHFGWRRPAAATLEEFGAKESGDIRSAAWAGTEAMDPEDERDAPKHLLSLLEEANRAMGEVQTFLRRIGVELERLGISKGALPDPSRPEACPELDSLSPRESEVAWMLTKGDRVSSIARALFVSPHTVRNHLQSIYRKLGVSSQAELIEKLKGPAGPGRAHRKDPVPRLGGSPYRFSGQCECLSPGHREIPFGKAEPPDIAG